VVSADGLGDVAEVPNAKTVIEFGDETGVDDGAFAGSGGGVEED